METQAIATDRVDFTNNGRSFGLREEPRQKFVPEQENVYLNKLGWDLNQQSALWRLRRELTGNGEPTREAVWEAYGQDLQLMKRYRDEFDLAVRAAVLCSVKYPPMSNMKLQDQADRTYNLLNGKIPPLGRVPLLELSHIRAAKEPAVQLRELADEFSSGVQRLLNLFGYWLQLLVEAELFGVAETTAPGVYRYHYFRHELSEKVVKEREVGSSTTTTADRAWNKITTVTEKQFNQTLFQERHIHTLVAGQVWEYQHYPRRLPQRVAKFLSSLPAWLRPLIRIVDGQMTMEEVVRLNVLERTIERREISDRYEYEPGVLLAGYVATGWSGQDLQTEPLDNYQGQTCAKNASGMFTQTIKLTRANKEGIWRALENVGMWALMALCLCVAWWAYQADKAGQAETAKVYQRYLQANQEGSHFTAEIGGLFQVGDRPLLKLGVPEYGGGEFELRVIDDIKLRRPAGYLRGPAPLNPVLEAAPSEVSFILDKSTGDSGKYGDIDLGPAFGLFYKVHVLSFKDRKMEYTLEKYGDSPWLR